MLVALVGWTTVARLVRGATLEPAARAISCAPPLALGAGPARIMLVHILPNLASPIIVATTLSVGEIILLESVLSFLGLGVAPPIASWGNMLTGAQETIALAPQLALYPGLLILRHGDRLQLPGRRAAGCARPAHGNPVGDAPWISRSSAPATKF